MATETDQGKTPHRPPASFLAACAVAVTAAAYAAAVTLSALGILDGASLLHGPVPVAVKALAALSAVGVLVAARTRPVLLAAAAVVAVALTAACAVALHATGTVRDHYPPTFLVWGAFVFLAAGAVVAAWPGSAWWARALTCAAIPVVAAGAFLLVNDHYDYWPTLGPLIGHGLPGEVSAAALRHEFAVPPGTLPAHGQLAPLDVPATVSRFAHLTGAIWVPPAIFANPRPRLPVLVMLGGTPGSPLSWPRAGYATTTADAYAAAHHGVAPVLVFVDVNGSLTGDTECVDGPKGKPDTYLTVDVRRFIAETFGTATKASQWGIVGFSEGGTCALDLVLEHPDVFGHFVDFAGDLEPAVGSPSATLSTLFGGDAAAMAAHDPLRVLASRGYTGTGVTGWFAAGADDGLHQAVIAKLVPPAKAAGIGVHEFVGPTGHTLAFAGSALRSLFPQLADTLGVGSAAQAPPAQFYGPFGAPGATSLTVVDGGKSPTERYFVEMVGDPPRAARYDYRQTDTFSLFDSATGACIPTTYTDFDQRLTLDDSVSGTYAAPPAASSFCLDDTSPAAPRAAEEGGTPLTAALATPAGVLVDFPEATTPVKGYAIYRAPAGGVGGACPALHAGAPQERPAAPWAGAGIVLSTGVVGREPSYSFLDRSALAGHAYCYAVASVALTGEVSNGTPVGPVTAGAVASGTTLIGATVSATVRGSAPSAAVVTLVYSGLVACQSVDHNGSDFLVEDRAAGTGAGRRLTVSAATCGNDRRQDLGTVTLVLAGTVARGDAITVTPQVGADGNGVREAPPQQASETGGTSVVTPPAT